MQTGFILCLGIAVDLKPTTAQMPKKVITVFITKLVYVMQIYIYVHIRRWRSEGDEIFIQDKHISILFFQYKQCKE